MFLTLCFAIRLEAWLKEQGIKHAPMVADVQRFFSSAIEYRPLQENSKTKKLKKS